MPIFSSTVRQTESSCGMRLSGFSLEMTRSSFFVKEIEAKKTDGISRIFPSIFAAHSMQSRCSM